MGKKKSDKFSAEEMKGLCKKVGVQVIQMKAPGHYRLVGGLAVDFWPRGGSAWVYGAKKSWKPKSVAEVVDVANLKLFPEGTEYTAKRQVADVAFKYINVENCCPVCRKSVQGYQDRSYTDRMVDLREFLSEKEDRINTKSYNGL